MDPLNLPTRPADGRGPGRALMLVIAAGVIAGCGGGDGNGGSGPNLAGIVVTPSSLNLADCGAQQLVVELHDSKGAVIPGAVFTFNSTLDSVATVSAGGQVGAQAPGSATIVIQSQGYLANVPVTVTAAPTVITGLPDTLMLWPTVADTLSPGLTTCHGAPVAGTVTLSGGSASIATVSGTVVTGVAYGSTTLTASGGGTSQPLPTLVIGRSLVDTIIESPLPGRPYGVAVTGAGRILVAQLDNNTLATGQFPSTVLTGGAIPAGTQPPHVAVNIAGTRAFVTDQAGQSVTVVDLTTDQAIATIPLSAEGFNLLVTHDGTQVFASTATGETYILDGTTGAKADSFAVGPASNGLAEHPSKHLVYISSRDAGTVSVFDRDSGAVVDTFLTGGRPQRMAVSPDGSRLYIANEDLGLDIWNTVTGQRVTSVLMPAYGLGLSPDGTQVIVTSAGPTIGVVSTATLAVRTLQTGGSVTRNVAYDPLGRTALVTDEADVVHFVQ